MSGASQTGVPEGWQLVPKEPTREMLKAGAWARHSQACDGGHNIVGREAAEVCWPAMLSAAPQPPTVSETVERRHRPSPIAAYSEEDDNRIFALTCARINADDATDRAAIGWAEDEIASLRKECAGVIAIANTLDEKSFTLTRELGDVHEWKYLWKVSDILVDATGHPDNYGSHDRAVVSVAEEADEEIATLTRERDQAREALARTERNRDMWKDQCARQANQLSAINELPQECVNSLTHQRQIDMDGCEVGVSRQAVDEIHAALKRARSVLHPEKEEKA